MRNPFRRRKGPVYRGLGWKRLLLAALGIGLAHYAFVVAMEHSRPPALIAKAREIAARPYPTAPVMVRVLPAGS